jgi:hypothetical protein
VPAKKRNRAKLQKFHEKAVRKLKIRYTASVIRNSFFRPNRSVR